MLLQPNTLNQMAYFMDTEHPALGPVSEYHVYMNDRVVFKVLVQISDENCVGGAHPICFPVWVTSWNDGEPLKLSDAHARRKLDKQTGKTRISSDSVKYVVFPQLPWILAELYVPKN